MRAEPSALRTIVTREEAITVTSAENPPPVTGRAADQSMRTAARADYYLTITKGAVAQCAAALGFYIGL